MRNRYDEEAAAELLIAQAEYERIARPVDWNRPPRMTDPDWHFPPDLQPRD